MEKKRVNLYSLLALFLLIIVIIFLWDTKLVYPVKLFVVLLHELSHGLAALITGGSVERMIIDSNQGGLCIAIGGNKFAVISAGYLGSMFWGGLILVVSARSRFDKAISIIIGAAVLLVTAFFIRNVFGLIYGILFGLAMIGLGIFASMEVNDFLLRIIGLTSVLYAVIDIKSDLISRQVPSSDASRLAAEYFGTPLMWGIIWGILALGMAFLFFRISARE